MRHICNAFALSMLSHSTSLNARRLSVTEASRLARGVDGVRVESAVGHAETAALFSTELGVPVEHRRVSVSLTLGSDLLVGQYTGPRLTEGPPLSRQGPRSFGGLCDRSSVDRSWPAKCAAKSSLPRFL